MNIRVDEDGCGYWVENAHYAETVYCSRCGYGIDVGNDQFYEVTYSAISGASQGSFVKRAVLCEECGDEGSKQFSEFIAAG